MKRIHLRRIAATVSTLAMIAGTALPVHAMPIPGTAGNGSDLCTSPGIPKSSPASPAGLAGDHACGACCVCAGGAAGRTATSIAATTPPSEYAVAAAEIVEHPAAGANARGPPVAA